MIRKIFAALVLLVFISGSVLAANIGPPSTVISAMKAMTATFEKSSDIVPVRFATGWVTVIYPDATLPGHKPKVEARCNSPN